MLRLLVLAGLFAAWSVPALAADSQRKMVSEAAQARWQAVGRLNVAGQGFCTATLIDHDLVLTAAHCVINRRTGRLMPAQHLHFLAGFRKGSFAVHGRAAKIIPARGYVDGDRGTGRDMALVRLTAPIAPDLVAPLQLADEVAIGEEVASYSYGRDRSFILSAQSSCHILGRENALLGTSCEATPGVSGAPLVKATADGPRVVGVITAMTRAKPPLMRGRALAVAVDARARSDLFDGALPAAR